MSEKFNLKTAHFETLQLHVGQEQADPATDSRAVPIYQTTSYVFHSAQHASDRFHLKDPGNIYGRLTNTTQSVFEERIAALEGGVGGLAVASGAAAITYAIRALARGGDHVVAQRTIYGGTYNLLQHTLRPFGIDTTFVNTRNLKEVEAAINAEEGPQGGSPGVNEEVEVSVSPNEHGSMSWQKRTRSCACTRVPMPCAGGAGRLSRLPSSSSRFRAVWTFARPIPCATSRFSTNSGALTRMPFA